MFRMVSVVIQKAVRGKIVNLATRKASAIDFMLRDQKRLWNWYHSINTEHYEKAGHFIFYNEAAALLTQQRKAGIFSDGSIAAQQQCLRSYEKALKQSFPGAENRRGFPKPKQRASDCSFRFPAKNIATVRIGDILTHIRLPKIGLVRIRNLNVPVGAKINSYCVKKEADGYWLSVQFAITVELPVNDNESVVGIDGGLSVMASLSDGEQIQALRPLRKNRKKLRTAQRSLSRKKRGSVNSKRQAKKVARVHSIVRHARRNAQHQLSRRLINDHGLIAIETLSLSGLRRLKHQGFAWSDIGLGEFFRQLRYKAGWAGAKVYVHPRFGRSTGCCPDCGHIGERLDLRIRRWTCTQCGTEHDRDVAAARWLRICAIVDREIANRGMVGAACPEPVKSKRAQSPKRGGSGSAPRTSAVMRPEISDPPAHDGSPANRPFEDALLAHASTG